MKSIFVILNYNDADTAAKLVNTVADYTCLEQIIVVDNCSSDDSFAALSKLENEKISVIQASENGGYAKGNHFGISYGIEHFNPDCIFVANPDVSVKEECLLSIMGAMKTHPQYGVISAIVNQGYNVWNLPGFLGMLESLFLIWFNLDKRNIKSKLMTSRNTLEKVGVVEGSFFGIRREAYEKCGGFDLRTFLYVEENILAKRMKEAGFDEGVLTSMRYDHFHSVSIKKQYKSRKAKAFPLFYDSMQLYNHEYLHINAVQDVIFKFCFKLAHFERMIYDFVKSV